MLLRAFLLLFRSWIALSLIVASQSDFISAYPSYGMLFRPRRDGSGMIWTRWQCTQVTKYLGLLLAVIDGGHSGWRNVDFNADIEDPEYTSESESGDTVMRILPTYIGYSVGKKWKGKSDV
ncbi:hypothetical protein C8J56DRAFT_890712 [Mycena floridula]|nr:hypothetical protein C8J56DRAFT_890712 [Mycena floridula]